MGTARDLGGGVQPGFVVAPPNDSGWVAVNGGSSKFVNGLGSTDVVIELREYNPFSDNEIDRGIDQTTLSWHNLTNTDIFVRSNLLTGNYWIAL